MHNTYEFKDDSLLCSNKSMLHHLHKHQVIGFSDLASNLSLPIE